MSHECATNAPQMRRERAANVVLELNPILKNALKNCQTSYWGGNCCELPGAMNAPQTRRKCGFGIESHAQKCPLKLPD